MQHHRLAPDVERSCNGHVDSRVAWRNKSGYRVPLVIVRHGRADWVPSAILLVLGKGLGGAPWWRVALNVGIVGTTVVALGLCTNAFNEFQIVLVVCNASMLVLRKKVNLVLAQLNPLQFILTLHARIPHCLWHAIDLARGFDDGILVHDTLYQMVETESLVKDQHEDLVAQVLAIRIVN